jgi:hypothetical protein
MIEIQGSYGIIKIHDSDQTNIEKNRKLFFDILKEALAEIDKNNINNNIKIIN